MSLKLVAIDLDATLLRDDKTYDIERFDHIVKELMKRGVTFVIASGNENPRIKAYLSDDTVNEVYIAGNNGNHVEKAGSLIHANYLDRSALLNVSDIIDADDDLQMVVTTLKKTYSKYIYDNDEDYIDIYFKNIHELDSYKDIPDDEEAIKAAILSAKSLSETKEVVNKIIEEVDGVTSVTSGGGWLDAYHEDGGKGSAIKWIQKTKGITPEETIAFGDSLNDGSMMAFAKYSVAMQNGDDEFKELCDYEIGTNEEQSVIDVLETYMTTGEMDFMKQFKK